MNIQEYISSGILEAYVLGELPQEEALEVEKMSFQHSEIKEEISKIEITLEHVAFETAIQPPAELKKSIIGQMGEKQEARVVSMPAIGPKTTYLKYAVAAAVTLAVVSSFLAYNYWNKWRSTQFELNSLIAQNERVAQDYNAVNQRLEEIEKDFGIINDASYHRVALQGTENAPQALASIYWNPTSEEVYLSIQNLMELSREQQYQLWAIIDGQPVDAGVFDVTESGLLKMKHIAGASAFAVTIEPRGGSVGPSLETMQVMGAVEKS